MRNAEVIVNKVFSIKVAKENSKEIYRKYRILNAFKNLVVCEDIRTGTKESFSYWDLEKNAIWER